MSAQLGYQHPAVPWNGLTVTDLFCDADFFLTVAA